MVIKLLCIESYIYLVTNIINNEIFEWFVLAVTLCIANYYPLVSGYIGMWHHADHMLERLLS